MYLFLHSFIHSFIHLILFSALLAFTSCDTSSIVDNEPDAPITYAAIADISASQTDKPSPKEVSESFFEMVEKVQKMSRESIDSLSNEMVLEFGKPILDVTQNTVKLSEATLQKLSKPLHDFTNSILTMSREEHKSRSREIGQIIASDRARTTRNPTVTDIRELLLKFNGGVMTMSSTCEDLFNVSGNTVTLVVGDNFDVANSLCPENSYFIINQGTHTGQSVSNSKIGNQWAGVSGAIMDGQGSTSLAFNGGMTDNIFFGIEIRDYADWGIKSQSGSSTNILISAMTFRNIGDDRSGFDDFGAIFFDYTEDVLVQNSYFNNVSHSVRFRFSNGPLQVLNNEALNTGFGFFQCNQCTGSNIRINNNSLEHTSEYGTHDLHDFINIYDSKGSSNNYIQVKNNRARVNLSGNHSSGVSQFGCAVLFGDEGGEYQEALDNIGVNPGACGIGLAAGKYMYVSNNKMFSQAVQPGISNVGFYSANYAKLSPIPECKYHHFVSQSNSADWMCVNPIGDCDPNNPIKNWAHADGSCTDQNNSAIDRGKLRTLINNETLGAGIWNDW